MSSYRHLIVILCALILSASIVSAKVYWLPDYLGENLSRSSDTDKSPSSGGGGNNGDDGKVCPNGWLTASQLGDKICVAKASYPWIGVCYGDCVCDTEKYPYTNSNCKGTYIPTGDECNDGTEHFTECEISCNLLTDKAPCTYGCKTYYSAEGCPSVCKECYTDNCRNREDNRTAEGKCEQYWQDCPDKCEIGETCIPNDCSSFTLTTVPANASYSTCTVGCGDNTTYYKIDTCNDCYTLNSSSKQCVAKTCSTGYATVASNCGSSFSHGKWVLGSSYSGCSGSNKCYTCVRDCDDGYTLSGTQCVEEETDPCAGYYECGGPWQYCTGYTCSADSTKCSVYCEDDYFRNPCSSASYCNGVWRRNYCSGTCNEPTTCNTNTYPYTTSNCSGTLGGGSCSDSYGTHYKTCTETASDPCDSYTDQTCDYGCASFYADCSSKCETCCEGGCGIKNMQEIANATAVNKNTCGYITSVKNCSSGYSPNGCSCTQDEICDFGCAFASSSNCPTGGTCNSITCGGETKYDLTSCSASTGYQKKGCECECKKCPIDSYQTTIDKNTACGEDPTTGGRWMLTTPASGHYTDYSCGIGCAVCYLACDSGYEPNSGTGYKSSGTTSCIACPNWSSYLEDCPDPYTCTSHKCQDDVRYSKTGCVNGYDWNNGNCTACTWPAKAISFCSSKDRDGKCTELSCGNQTKYMPNDCVDGYYLSGNDTTGYECVKI